MDLYSMQFVIILLLLACLLLCCEGTSRSKPRRNASGVRRLTRTQSGCQNQNCSSSFVKIPRSSTRRRPTRQKLPIRTKCEGTQTVQCLCGEGPDQAISSIEVDVCRVQTRWGRMCEPCEKAEEACSQLQNCTRCMQYNPHAICAGCKPDRHGLRCEEERPCKAPLERDFLTVHPYISKEGVYKVEFRCTEGRVLQGPKSLECNNNNGSWDDKPPKCVLPKTCSTPPGIPFAFSRVKVSTPEMQVFVCAEGYIPSGPVLETAMHCNNGAWVIVGEIILCKRSPPCFSLPSFLGAQPVASTPVKSSYIHGEMVQYECQEGFEPVHLHPSQEILFNLTCVDEKWSGDIPNCVLRGCPIFKVNDGVVVYASPSGSRSLSFMNDDSKSAYVALNTVANVTCLDGVALKGAQIVTCSSPNGEWLPEIPRCEADCVAGEMCVVSTTSPNVIALTGSKRIYPGQIARFGCKEGFYPKVNVGNKERVCLFNGTLSGSGIECGPMTFPVCKIDVTNRLNLRYCRGGCTVNNTDSFKDEIYELPSDVIPPFTKVEFFCEKGGLRDSDVKTLTCNPGQPFSRLSRELPQCEPGCGLRRPPLNRRILGGQESVIQDWPWQAAVYNKFGQTRATFLCGATLIHQQWAVTAAHCLTQSQSALEIIPESNLRVTYGQSFQTESKQAAINDLTGMYEIERVVLHDDYNNNTLDNDIALVKFRKPVQLGYTVGLACLPESLQCSDRRLGRNNTQVWVTGWGLTNSDYNSNSNSLQGINFTVVNNSECEQRFKDEGYNTQVFTENMLCATSSAETDDIADGDSGGPLVVQGNEQYVLEGIVSWSKRGDDDYPNPSRRTKAFKKRRARVGGVVALPETCAQGSCISGYTRVSRYIEWISKTIGIAWSTTSWKCRY